MSWPGGTHRISTHDNFSFIEMEALVLQWRDHISSAVAQWFETSVELPMIFPSGKKFIHCHNGAIVSNNLHLYIASLLSLHGVRRKRSLDREHITVIFPSLSHSFSSGTQFSPIPLPKRISITAQLFCLRINFSYKTTNYGMAQDVKPLPYKC